MQLFIPFGVSIVPKQIVTSGRKTWRMVIDYIRLNERTVEDKYPIPNITDVLDKLGRCQYYAILELASGYRQLEMSAEDV